MEAGEPAILSFVVKIQIEHVGEEAGERRSWSGYITHIPSGERRYVRTLDGIAQFISEYLARYTALRGNSHAGPRSWLRNWRWRRQR